MMQPSTGHVQLLGRQLVQNLVNIRARDGADRGSNDLSGKFLRQPNNKGLEIDQATQGRGASNIQRTLVSSLLVLGGLEMDACTALSQPPLHTTTATNLSKTLGPATPGPQATE